MRRGAVKNVLRFILISYFDNARLYSAYALSFFDCSVLARLSLTHFRIYRKIIARANMSQSMSRAGDCYDNTFMESCFGTIKTELEMTAYDSIQTAIQEIREYINYYNVIRRHSALDYLSPTRFEVANQI